MVLSIITVSKNCVETLERTFTSINRVKTNDIEYIVVDGESDDGTVPLIKSNVGLVDQWVSEPDGGVYEAMNKGVAMAKGRYILFLNGDDTISPNGFSAALECLKSSNDEVVSGRCNIMEGDDATGVVIPSTWRLLFINAIPHPSTFVQRDLLLSRPFRTSFRIAGDYDFFLFSFLNHVSFDLIDEVISNHYRGGISSDEVLAMKEVEQIRMEQLGWRKVLLDVVSSPYRIAKWIRIQIGVRVRK